MKFGKEFKTHLEETLPGWKDKFLCYKSLKKLLKNLPSTTVNSLPVHLHQRPLDNDVDPVENGNQPLEDLQHWFVRILNEELEKFNDFYVDKEEEFIIRFQELKERIETLKEKSSRGEASVSESEFNEEMMDIRKDFVSIHGEMVLLKNYSSLNFAGLVKILKKYDKRTGGLLRLPYTQLVLHQPFFTTEPLTRLVCECEENLEVLFPFKAEVVEPSSAAQDQSILPTNMDSSTPESSASVGEGTVDIYRSTLAAMRAIRGLQKASSTYNPLSFSSFYQSKDDGTVTAEDSDSSSSGILPRGGENDEETQSS